jgi:non-specific serine/threonine protein kinase
MDEALAMWRATGDTRETALALEGIGWVQLLAGQEEVACVTFEESLRLRQELGDPHLVNRGKVALAQALVVLGRVAEARPMAHEIIAFSQTHEDRRSEHFGWHYLADCALIEGACDASLALYLKSLDLARAIGDRLETAFELQGVGMSYAGLGHPERALRLVGAASAEFERIGANPRVRFWDALLERYLGLARASLGEDAANRASQEGLRVPFDQAVGDALAAGTDAAGQPRPLHADPS